MKRLTFGSLFAGIGGMDLGLERAGMQCVWQVEIDDYARRVLAKHWPHVRRWDDVRTFPPEGDWSCDLIAGGFPCQDISNAGKRAGIDGERSGLWSEYARIISVVRPRFVLVENVAALLGRGLARVLGDLAALGFDAEWDCLPAGAFGAPYCRDRVFILAYPDREHGRARRTRRPVGVHSRPEQSTPGETPRGLGREGLPAPEQERKLQGPVAQSDWWSAEPDVVRVVPRVPSRVDRIRGLGNAVVPQVSQWIGRRILEASQESTP